MKPFLTLTLGIFVSICACLQATKTDKHQNDEETFSSSINAAVDPCDDFYEFACGGRNPPNEDPVVAATKELRKMLKKLLEDPVPSNSTSVEKLKMFYGACLKTATDTTTNALALEYLEQLGGWPILRGSKWSEKDFDLIKLQMIVDEEQDTSPLLSIGYGEDDRNNSRFLLSIDPGDLFSKSRAHYIDKDGGVLLYGSYVPMVGDIRETAMNLAEDEDLVKDLRRSSDPMDIYEFEIEVARLLDTGEEFRNATEEYHLVKLKDLHDYISFINWTEYFERSVPPKFKSLITPEFEILVSNPEYLRKLNVLLNKTNPRIIANYVMWRLLNAFLEKVPGNKESDEDYWVDCLRNTVKNMHEPATAFYVSAYYSKKTQNAVSKMVADLKFSFREILKSIRWMDTATKKAALAKLNKMRAVVGHSAKVLNLTAVDEQYEQLRIEPNMSYVEILMRYATFTKYTGYEALSKPVDRDDVILTPDYANAFYEQTQNKIVIPAWYQRSPFFNISAPSYMNYGALGFVIGHEITHGYDDDGAQRDGNGNIRDWWQDEALENFNDQVDCLIQQYSGIKDAETEKFLNGRLTRAENVADCGGIKAAHKAYQRFLQKNGPEKRLPGTEKYSLEQLFFISFAQLTHEQQMNVMVDDEHSLPKYRVNVPLMNYADFSRVFSCPLGSPMNPKTKCSVW